jgi:hypothetical protein
MTDDDDLHDATWASADEALLRLVARTLTDAGAAVSPMTRVDWMGYVSFAVAIRSRTPLPPPPDGVRTEAHPVAGVFMRGAPPAYPTPLEWMDRISAERQVAVLEALDVTPQGRRFKARLLAARTIDPAHAEVAAGVGMLRAAGVLGGDEAAALLRLGR